ncbi:HAD-IA family hydrolase [Prosthecodimorpha staleyi]|uniref:HAD-IA family hydrolase n=1 Tax=Prosthecodimorpha staleyi TaxID=2840188 RepID=A0A947GFF9_9HYPH|nr:HAD-IA family hydrolase [Prosthecodimorpha staleyi]MBT9293162.1 HAD-IA family hydrolase [Prosthecodimorpha staleyi]
MSFADFKVLTFDIVGTCIDFERGVLDGFRNAGGPAAAKLSEEEIFGAYLAAREHFPGAASAVMRDVYLLAAKNLGLPTDEAAADCYFRFFFNAPAFPDSVDALRRLRRKFRLVAMTNYDRVAYTNCANKLGLPFHDSVTSDEAKYPKPDPRFFAFNLGRQSAFGYKQEEILHVAQSQHHDIGVARELGYKVCWIERRKGLKGFGGTPVPKVLTKPDFHFATLGELADAVERG